MAILLVDDSGVARLHLQMLLAAAGYQDVVTAGSPAEAFRALGLPEISEPAAAAQTATAAPPHPEIDLVLLDVVMPEMDGVSVCRYVKADERYRDVPVIMVTAQSETDHLAAAFAAGAMDYIVKPANEVELIARVRSALRLRQEILWRKEREREVNAQLARALSAERALAGANERLTDQASALATELEERQRTAAALQESESRYRALVEHSADAIAIVADGTVAFANGAFVALHRLRGPGDALGAAFGRFVDDADWPRVRDQLLVRHWASGGPTTVEYRTAPIAAHPPAPASTSSGDDTATVVRRPAPADGADEPLSVEAVSVAITYDRRPATLVVIRDISERRALERLKEEFISMVTHELRTPLTSIKGYADLLLEDDPDGTMDPEERREFVGVIKSSADRLVTLVNDLLDLSRIEAGRVELRHRPEDLAGLLDAAMRSFRPQVEQKRQRLSLDVDPALPPVEVDGDRITQVLVNLVSNAHKYTPAGGEIAVSAHRRGEMVHVEVRDTGIGLTPDEQERLFTKFFRSGSQTARAERGTGLGLVISRSLVQLHGGDLQVTSAPGEGSTFSFTLPLAATQVKAHAA